jgi:hypothetical protein
MPADEAQQAGGVQLRERLTLTLDIPVALEVLREELVEHLIEEVGDGRGADGGDEAGRTGWQAGAEVGGSGCIGGCGRAEEGVGLEVGDELAGVVMCELEDTEKGEGGDSGGGFDQLFDVGANLCLLKRIVQPGRAQSAHHLLEDALEKDLHDLRGVREDGLNDLRLLIDRVANILE